MFSRVSVLQIQNLCYNERIEVIRMFKRKCKITFVSHGATVHTLDGIICDTEKYPKLNEFGEEEMEKVCGYLENRAVAYDKIYTSASARCTQSAEIIAKLFKKKITIIDLPARNHGDWNGRSYEDLFDQYGPEVILQQPNNGESLEVFNKRVSDIIDRLVEENRGNRIIVVTSPDVIQSAIAKTLELTAVNQFKNLIKTGTLTQISYFEGDWSSVIYSDHMPV